MLALSKSATVVPRRVIFFMPNAADLASRLRLVELPWERPRSLTEPHVTEPTLRATDATGSPSMNLSPTACRRARSRKVRLVLAAALRTPPEAQRPRPH